MIKVLYFSRENRDSVWEYDYIKNEILNEIKFKPYFLSLDEVRETSETFDVFIYSCRDPSIYEWGYMPSYDDVLECVSKLKPKIVIQLSDEYAHEDLGIHNEISKYCNLMLRQYWHAHKRKLQFGTPMPKYDNLIHMPLGYLNDFVMERKNILPIRNRRYAWSFVGKIKDDQFYYYNYDYKKWLPTTDRKQMIEIFSSNIKRFYFKESGVDKNELIKVYNNSIFVPCGRGNAALDCFRNYEATICGAIPVVVGRNYEEIGNSFNYAKLPPWLYADTWEHATVKCKYLLNNPDQLQKMQNEILEWWDEVIGDIQNLVLNNLEII